MVKFMPTFLAIPSIVSWMFWLNGFGTSGMRNMLLPRNVDGSMGSPGAVKVGSALYLATLSVTAAATALPLPELVVALPPLVSQPVSAATSATAPTTPRRIWPFLAGRMLSMGVPLGSLDVQYLDINPPYVGKLAVDHQGDKRIGVAVGLRPAAPASGLSRVR